MNQILDLGPHSDLWLQLDDIAGSYFLVFGTDDQAEKELNDIRIGPFATSELAYLYIQLGKQLKQLQREECAAPLDAIESDLTNMDDDHLLGEDFLEEERQAAIDRLVEAKIEENNEQ